ncbi:unnamed protein product [Eruca vesicaria subsp. sativa]|uniref:Uncharacterized protein n=1 Tax=Eruca vesicaria subsp. sativa TaxID=29727 RepID=A0ABC8LRU5_ERUVS|nr:unnamed protein product [Eruca vesicaria subsp. sativa]
MGLNTVSESSQYILCEGCFWVIKVMCRTGPVSFTFYDWNPTELPQRPRRQVLQKLAIVSIDLEGYILPKCTALTVFIAMAGIMCAKAQ